MKKFTVIAFVLVLTLGLFTGCRGTEDNMTTPPATTTPSTSRPATAPSTQATTETTMPGMDDVIPGPEDTIDPSNGANESTDNTGARGHSRF